MVIIVCLYAGLVWLIFSKLKLARWGWLSGMLAVSGGISILALFMALFNSLTPTGKFVIGSHVIEVTPNVSGQIVDIPAQPNVWLNKNTVLFRIDPAPFQYKVDQLAASLVQAKQQAEQLRANYDQATANVDGLDKHLTYQTQRLKDIRTLATEGTQAQFKLQDQQAQYDTVLFQLQAAKAAQSSAKLALDSEVSGVNTTVASTLAQLDNAKWELEQTTIRAPQDGYVATMGATAGDRASPARSVMGFIVGGDITIVGMFLPNGFETIRPGSPVKLVFYNQPGRIYHARIVDAPRGVGEGQIAVSGMLTRAGSIGGARSYPASISIPSDIDRSKLRLGMPGVATVYAENAGVIGMLMSILVWISSYTAYL